MALNQHPDLAAELTRRMSGEPPAVVGQGAPVEQKPARGQTQPDLLSAEELRQGDEETNEQYVARVTRLAAQRAAELANQTAKTEVAGIRADIERQQENTRIIEGYKADPLFGITGKVLHHMVQTGQISQALAMKADRDPDVFQALYNQARVQAVQFVQAHAAQQQARAPMTQTQEPAPQSSRVRINRPAAPAVEVPGAGRRGRGGTTDQVRMQVLEDMDPEKFAKLRESIKSGDTGAWNRLGR